MVHEMEKRYRIVFESYDATSRENSLSSSVIIDEAISKPTNCLDFSIEHHQQIQIIQTSLDKIIAEKAKLLNQDSQECPECSGILIKIGNQQSTFHDVFTDHEVNIQRLRCVDCKHEPAATVRTVLNGTLSGALAKIQSELGSSYTFRDSESLLETFSTQKRKINNRNRIKNVIHSVGEIITSVDEQEKELLKYNEAEELILNVDGGHVKTTEDQRSIEALTSVVYRPESLVSNRTGTRNEISEKSCAASVKDDEQKEIINNTIIAAMKQGLTPRTHITALCDGAANCWNVADALKPLCSSMDCILDWFHISMKMQNISLPEKLKTKFTRIKWHLWRGNVSAACSRISQLISTITTSKSIDKLKKFKTYIQNNADRIVNYRERKKKGLTFTSNLAESTVESLINQRCKGQQHMRWSREGLNPILQLRAKIHTNDWDNKWRTVILNSAL